MSIKETITKELLDRIDDPAGLEEVLKRHSRSKGPLYLAIAEATTALGSGFETLAQNRQAIQKELDQLAPEPCDCHGLETEIANPHARGLTAGRSEHVRSEPSMPMCGVNLSRGGGEHLRM